MTHILFVSTDHEGTSHYRRYCDFTPQDPDGEHVPETDKVLRTNFCCDCLAALWTEVHP